MISLIITNYNTWDLTERCVKSVTESNSDHEISEIIIVDDFSKDITPDSLKYNSKVNIIRNNTNLGYAKSVNIGFKNATNEICLLLDSDAYLVSGLSKLSSTFEKNKDLGLLGMLLIDENDNPTGRLENEVDFWSILLGQQIHQKFVKLFPKKNAPISLFSCGIAVRKKAFDDVKGFDDGFDFLDADHDFSMKINRSKWKIEVTNSIKIFHKGGGSLQLTSKRVIRFYQNRLKLLRKHKLIKFEKPVLIIMFFRILLEYIYFRLTIMTANHTKEKEQLSDKAYSRKEIIKFILKEI